MAEWPDDPPSGNLWGVFVEIAPYDSDVGIQELGEMWLLALKGVYLRCRLTTHPLGWELRLEKNGVLIKSEVCKLQPGVFDKSDEWRIHAIAGGWQPLE